MIISVGAFDAEPDQLFGSGAEVLETMRPLIGSFVQFTIGKTHIAEDNSERIRRSFCLFLKEFIDATIRREIHLRAVPLK